MTDLQAAIAWANERADYMTLSSGAPMGEAKHLLALIAAAELEAEADAPAREDGLLEASIAVRDDMVMRATMGTFDGDHEVQMGDGVWCRFCAAIENAGGAPLADAPAALAAPEQAVQREKTTQSWERLGTYKRSEATCGDGLTDGPETVVAHPENWRTGRRQDRCVYCGLYGSHDCQPRGGDESPAEQTEHVKMVLGQLRKIIGAAESKCMPESYSPDWVYLHALDCKRAILAVQGNAATTGDEQTMSGGVRAGHADGTLDHGASSDHPASQSSPLTPTGAHEIVGPFETMGDLLVSLDTPTGAHEGLIACPFCGKDAAPGTIHYDPQTVKFQHWTQEKFHYVSCCWCGSNNKGLVGHATPEKAAEHWNRRAALQAGSPVAIPREPTEKMLNAGERAIVRADGLLADVWRAMYDAALDETTK